METQAARLIANARWLALATVDADGEPVVGYVPFVVAGGAFAIAVSGLAAHTRHLRERSTASILLVDELDPGDAFARARLTVAVDVHFADERGSDAVWSALAARHGQTVGMVRGLADFTIVGLVPTGARAVLGFASAHDLGAPALAAMLHEIGG